MEIPCTCGKGLAPRRISNSEANKNRVYYACPDSKPKQKDYGCGFFLWEDELKCPDVEKQTAQSAPKNAGASCSSSSSPGPSSAGKVEKQTAQSAPKNAGASCSSSSSPGPSSAGKGSFSAGKGSGGLEANCPNCKLLLVKIKTLEAKLYLATHHQDPSQSAGLQELLAGIDEIFLDEL